MDADDGELEEVEHCEVEEQRLVDVDAVQRVVRLDLRREDVDEVERFHRLHPAFDDGEEAVGDGGGGAGSSGIGAVEQREGG